MSKRQTGADVRLGCLLNAPALIAILAVIGYPMLQTFWFSLHRYTVSPPRFAFVGLEQYLAALRDPQALAALRFTLAVGALSIPLTLAIGLAGGLILNEPFPGRSLARALVVIPWAVPQVVGGEMFASVFDSQLGVLNRALYALGVIEEHRPWLLDPGTAMMAIVSAHVWAHAPVAIIVSLASLQAVPPELYDAARLDRAGVLDRFLHVTWPWLRQAALIVLILQTISAMKVYDLVYVLTGGGPGTSTTTIALLAFQTSFVYLDFGLGSAYAFVIASVTLVLSLAYFRVLYARGDLRV